MNEASNDSKYCVLMYANRKTKKVDCYITDKGELTPSFRESARFNCVESAVMAAQELMKSAKLRKNSIYVMKFLHVNDSIQIILEGTLSQLLSHKEVLARL